MSEAFDNAWEKLLAVEGDYSNEPGDRPTRFGITEPVARAHGYMGAMRALPLEEARAIAKEQYWNPLRLDGVAEVSGVIAEELFDTGYNMGLVVAATFLQRSLNVLNRLGTDYPDLAVDGHLGPVTLMRLREFVDRRGTEGTVVLLRALNSLQGSHYVEIAEENRAKEAFVYGWFRNRVT